MIKAVNNFKLRSHLTLWNQSLSLLHWSESIKILRQFERIITLNHRPFQQFCPQTSSNVRQINNYDQSSTNKLELTLAIIKPHICKDPFSLEVKSRVNFFSNNYYYYLLPDLYLITTGNSSNLIR